MPRSRRQVEVVGLAGPVCRIEVDPVERVGACKERIAEATRIPKHHQRLFFDTTELQDPVPLEEVVPTLPARLVLTLLRRPQEEAKWLEEVEDRPWHLRFAPPELRRRRDFALAAVGVSAEVLVVLGASLRADPQVLLAAARQNTDAARLYALPANYADPVAHFRTMRAAARARGPQAAPGGGPTLAAQAAPDLAAGSDEEQGAVFPTPAPPVPSAPPPAPPARRRPRRGPAAVLLTALVLALVAAAATAAQQSAAAAAAARRAAAGASPAVLGLVRRRCRAALAVAAGAGAAATTATVMAAARRRAGLRRR